VAKRLKQISVVLGVLATLVAFSYGGGTLSWELKPTGSAARLRGLSVVSAKVVWTSGSLGTVLRSTDAGTTWQSVGPPDTTTLQFRDIEAFDADNAVILSIGPGGDSRVYVTSDGGAHWTQTFTNPDPNAFYDCMTFFDRRHGLALSDPVDGKFRIIATNDGGQSWSVVAADMPDALPGEFAFAASGQCITSAGGRNAWFGTGGGTEARVFRSDDRGETWKVSTTGMTSGPTAGIFALAFRDRIHGLAIGGDFLVPDAAPKGLALTSSGGRHWQLVPDADAPNEYRSGATWINGTEALAVGPTGSDVSFNRGRNWTEFDGGSFDTVDCAGGSACWASGEQGRVARLVRSH
jgi:photosystem II stability/assembly factor-like uncharacterized protein